MNEEENAWLQEQDSITVAIYPYHPPYQIINKEGNVDGIFSEYMELIEQKIGYTFKKNIYDTWPSLMDDVEKGKVDIVVEMHPTKNREAYLNFYALLFESPQVVVTRKNKFSGRKLSDFKNKTIILPEDYAIAEIIKQKEPEIVLATGKDDLSCLQELNHGKYDAYIGPRAVVNYIIRANNLNDLEITGETQFNYNSGIAVFKENKTLNAIFSKATKSITRSEKQAILDNWIFNVVTPFYQKTSFWVLLSAIILFATLVISLINRYLKYKIRQKTKELRIAKELAEESNQLKTAFIHNISHEVRTPMNGIIGFSELLNDPGTTPEKQREYSKIIIESSHQLIRIIDDIIEISKLQTNQVELQLEEVNLNELLETLFSQFQNLAIDKKIAIHLDNKLTEEEGTILMDKSKIRKILTNLIDNAIKFTQKGLVEISSEVKANKLFITIRDTGIGINTKDQEIIFKNFSQSEKEVTKSYDGLGLGLSIAKKNAELLKGNITFNSILGKGSTFTLEVPHHPIFDPGKDNRNMNTSTTQELPIKQVILIVEDGDVNFLFLKTILLKMLGYKFVIHRAENGKEAVDICENNKDIDLVLMDIRMPVMDGYTATKKIKKMRPGLPVVAQTAYSTEEDIQKALDAGCDDFVSKPVDRKLLRPIIGRYFSSFSQ
ncbi:transporter substrate-binding domain-containing protein [Aquimarina gracilis]|uniref:histidine kinase n=1 Tax=Aquimarina gracilis TaxID=874422 RepID=A0ABU5ZWE6_9FLAO|nr:transporter substrate-binding domain-containing protein [Aquimarina gracilis]MEB3346199.1 transporter substrate-binding domain-containing protein [Aquimarina gracilis]